jgi:succinyl-diaminopimelate desuccinylase
MASRLILGADEECGSSDLEHYYGIEKEAEYTFSPDANFPLINIEKARLAKKFTARPSGGLPTHRVSLRLTQGSKANVVPGTADAAFRGLTKEQLEPAARETERKTKATVTWGAGGRPGDCSYQGGRQAMRPCLTTAPSMH